MKTFIGSVLILALVTLATAALYLMSIPQLQAGYTPHKDFCICTSIVALVIAILIAKTIRSKPRPAYRKAYGKR
jgi:hypothetical protein